jgi:hypothetical protein
LVFAALDPAPLDLVAPDFGAVDFAEGDFVALAGVFAVVLWLVGGAVAGLVDVGSLVEL